ncbi:MAG: flagellar M-ring protein FliF [Cellulosilyticum sp.]|nr:flagellar M-ring protein FliF [Cellulosilyticum sp.]
MQETIQQMSNQVTEKWNNLSKKQKIWIGLGAVALIITIVIVSLLMQPKYKILLPEAQDTKVIAAIKSVLDEHEIKNRLINDSTNIEVQEESYQEALMYAASSEVMETGISWEDLVNNDMSTTDFEKNVKDRELKRQDLERTIELIEGVEDARVELVTPEQKNAYLQSQTKSNASVFLTLSRQLSSAQCETIANYVAASVENLKRENVVIIDSAGKTLYSGADDANTTVGKQQELKAAAESEVKQKILDLIGNMYDDVRISTNLVLDFDQYQEVKEQYSTQGDDESRGVIQQESESKSSSTNGSSGAVPGTDTNGGDVATYQTVDGTTSESKDTTKDIIYSPDKSVSTYTKNTGDVDLEKSSLSVNVFSNKIYKEEMVTPTLTDMTWEEFKETNRNQTALVVEEQVVSLIQNATGIKSVVVSAYENPIFLDEEEYVIDYKDYIPYILIVAVLLIIVFIVLKFRKQEEVVEVEPELEVEEMLKAAKEEVELEEIELKESLETKRQIDKFVDEKPEAVANLLRNWLSDEDWE